MSNERPDPDSADRDKRELLDRDAPGPLEIEQPSGPGQYRKVRAQTGRVLDADVADDQPLTAVIEVTEPGYRPAGVDLRGFITETVLTCTVRPSALAELDQDPRITSIELSGRA